MTEVKKTEMNFFDHIKELRQKLMYSIIFFIITFVISFYFSQSIFEFKILSRKINIRKSVS